MMLMVMTEFVRAKRTVQGNGGKDAGGGASFRLHFGIFKKCICIFSVIVDYSLL